MLFKRILRGIGQMAWPSVASAIVAIVVYSQDKQATTGENAAPLPLLLGIYAGTAVLSGAIIGALKPWSRAGLGVVATYIAAVLPFTAAMVILARGGHIGALRKADVIGALILAFIVGPVVAAFVHIRAKQPKGNS